MQPRRCLTAVGSGLASVVLVAGVVVQLASAQLPSSGPAESLLVGSGAVIGLLLGVVAGSVVGLAVARGFETWEPSTRRITSGYAAFGIVFCGLVVLSSVAPGRVGNFLSFEVLLGASLFALAVVHGSYYTRELPQDSG